MSPITHVLIGWVASQPLPSKRERLLVTVASILPDIDGLSLLAGVDAYHKYHHTFGHNLLAALTYAIFCSLLSVKKGLIFLLALLSFHLHLLTDLMGSGEGWGIPYLWPFSSAEIVFHPPFQWELDSWQNVLTTVMMMGAIYVIALKKDRTIMELVSVKMDQKIVAVLKGWSRKS